VSIPNDSKPCRRDLVVYRSHPFAGSDGDDFLLDIEVDSSKTLQMNGDATMDIGDGGRRLLTGAADGQFQALLERPDGFDDL
jgi:hypothetical protein